MADPASLLARCRRDTVPARDRGRSGSRRPRLARSTTCLPPRVVRPTAANGRDTLSRKACTPYRGCDLPTRPHSRRPAPRRIACPPWRSTSSCRTGATPTSCARPSRACSRRTGTTGGSSSSTTPTRTRRSPSGWRGLDDPRVTVVRHEANIGITANYRECLARATQEHVVFLGCDDVLLPDYVGVVLDAFAAVPEAVMVQPGVRVVDETGTPVGRAGRHRQAAAAPAAG